MQLTPHYGADPLIVIEGDPAAILEPLVRQRRRFAALLADFDDDRWAAPSRCDGWSNRDVVVHLDSTNAFWSFSIASGLKGEPSRFLASFDPVASPAELVAGSDLSGAAAGERFAASTEALCQLLTGLDDAGWRTLAEAPPGHLSVAAVAHHALWDSWVHERDVLLPLGEAPTVEADEVAATLRYAAALSPAFAVNGGRRDGGLLAVAVTDPEVAFEVEVADRVTVRDVEVPDGPAGSAVDRADLVLRGDAVDLAEALSVRRPLDQQVPGPAAWMVAGLAEVFDAAG
jgi:uncharacterized protein (TIGR03083 family)